MRSKSDKNSSRRDAETSMRDARATRTKNRLRVGNQYHKLIAHDAVLKCLTDERDVDDQFAERVATRSGKNGQGRRRDEQRVRAPRDQGRYLSPRASRCSTRTRSASACPGHLYR